MNYKSRAKTGLISALFFIIGFTLSLHALSPVPGWGEAPVIALASVTLKRATFFGFPFLEMLTQLLFIIIPFSDNAFSLNLSGPILYGLTVSLIFSIARKISDCWFIASCATIAVILLNPIFSFFASLTPAAMSIFLIICLIFTFESYMDTGNIRTFFALIFISGASIFQSGANALLIISVFVALIIKEKTLRTKSPSFWAPIALVFFLLSSLLIFAFLRPPLVIDFSSSLPPWLGVLSPLDNIAQRIVKLAPLRDMLSNLLQIAKIIVSPVSIFFIIWLIASFFKRKDSLKLVSLLPVPVLLLALFSIKDSSSFHLSLFTLLFIVAGAPSLFSSRNDSASNSNRFSPLLAIIAVAPLIYVNFAPSLKARIIPDSAKVKKYVQTIPRDEIVFSGNEDVSYTETFIVENENHRRMDISWKGRLLRPKIFSIHGSGSEEYFQTFLKGLRRDAVLVADPVPDNLHMIYFYRDFYGLRKDVDILYTRLILNKEYREYMWKREYPTAKIPDREEYAKLIGQVATMTRQPGVITQNNRVRERIIQGMSDLLNDAILIQNSNFRPMYYNRIDNIINSQMYQLMYFDPAAYSFRLLMYKPKPFGYERFIDMATSSVTSDAVGKEIVATYFRNIGEHFYSQDKQASAIPFLETCSSLNQKDISCRFFLGLIYKSWGKYDLSELNFTKALQNIQYKKQNAGQDSGDILMLARIYRELGRNTEAIKYEKLVEPGAMSGPPPAK